MHIRLGKGGVDLGEARGWKTDMIKIHHVHGILKKLIKVFLNQVGFDPNQQTKYHMYFDFNLGLEVLKSGI